MMDLYNLATTQQRLSQSVIRYKNDPVYVSEIDINKDGDIVAHCFFLLNKKKSVFKIADDGLDTMPVPLGFMNLDDGFVVDVTRCPHRAWKIGLASSNALGDYFNFRYENQTNFPVNSYLSSTFLGKTIVGDYPSYKTAMERWKYDEEFHTQCYGIAFDRNFAIVKANRKSKERSLQHRFSGIVGVCEDKPILNKEFFFLKETLEEAVNGH